MSETQGSHASPIDGVIADLKKVIRWSKEKQSRLGVFAALYLRVTNDIRDKIGTGFFDDDQRMEEMDVAFAGRYLRVAHAFQQGSSSFPAAWAVAMDALDNADLIVVQQLLLAMNPHINIDLGAAAAAIAPGDKIDAFHADFMKINDVLAQIVPTVIEEIDEISPLIDLVSDVAQSQEEAIINFSMAAARDAAWDLATKLAPLDPVQQQRVIDDRNQVIAVLGESIVDLAMCLTQSLT